MLCLAVIVVIASYLPVLGAPFVWDDHHLIEDSPLIVELRPVREYFQQSFWQSDELGQGRTYYRPLAILSLAIDHELYGESSGGFHLTNLLVHLLSTVLLFRLLCVRGVGGYAAVLAATIWALHPRLTEAVAWISGRTDVLASCFVLAALLAQARPSTARRMACALLLLLGLLCKEVALAGVAAVLVLELWPSASLLARLRRALPVLLALGTYLLLRMRASGVVAPRSVGAVTLALRATAAVGHYFAMFLTPWLPNLQIGLLPAPGASYAALGGALLLALGWALFRLRRRLTVETWSAIALSAVGLGLVLHIVPFSINVLAADRFLYLPLLGIALLVTPMLCKSNERKRVTAAAGLLSVSFAAATFVRARTWADEVQLWTATYRDNPENEFLACSQLGRLYVQAGLFAHALSIYQGCTVTPGRQLVLTSNGAALLARSGRYREALTALDRLGAGSRRTPLFSLNRALFNTYLNDFGAARRALAEALEADPNYTNALVLSRQLPSLERDWQQLAELPASVPSVSRARLLLSLGLVARALNAWGAAFAEGSLSRADAEEGLALALQQGDRATLEAFQQQYLQRFGQHLEPGLELAIAARADLAQRLLAVWPRLKLPLLALPDRLGS